MKRLKKILVYLGIAAAVAIPIPELAPVTRASLLVSVGISYSPLYQSYIISSYICKTNLYYMKTLFKEYFYPSETDIKEVWNDSLIVFDTCALLNLYRYTEKTRDDFVNLLESNKERLWIPYQVATEFLQDKKDVIKSQEKADDKINQNTVMEIENLKKVIK